MLLILITETDVGSFLVPVYICGIIQVQFLYKWGHISTSLFQRNTESGCLPMFHKKAVMQIQMNELGTVSTMEIYFGFGLIYQSVKI